MIDKIMTVVSARQIFKYNLIIDFKYFWYLNVIRLLLLTATQIDQLHQVHIDAFPELPADLPHHADVLKSGGPVKPDARLVSSRDPGNDRMQTGFLSLFHDFPHQNFSEALPPFVRPDIKGDFSRVVVRAPVRPGAQTGPAGHPVIFFGDEDGMAFAMAVKPFPLLFETPGFRVKGRHGVQNGFIVDGKNGFNIPDFCLADYQLRPASFFEIYKKIE
jgi:hypothetical protein